MSETLEQRILRHEGMRLKPYFDTRNILTIGVGRNLRADGISEDEAMYLFRNDLAARQEAVQTQIPWSAGLDDLRRGVLVEMVFQMGIARILAFTQTLAAMQRGDWDAAADAMLQSAWHIECPARSEELSRIMRTGVAA